MLDKQPNKRPTSEQIIKNTQCLKRLNFCPTKIILNND